jgi:hypothetical protein
MKLIKEAVKKETERASAKVYPDTKKGVIAMLKSYMSPTYLKKYDLDNAQISGDPYVGGVWKVDFPRKPNSKTQDRWIVYLAGYKDMWHRIREENDVEQGEVPAREMRDIDESVDDDSDIEAGAKTIIMNILAGKLEDLIPGAVFEIENVSKRNHYGRDENEYKAFFQWEDANNTKNWGKGSVEFVCRIEGKEVGIGNRQNLTDLKIFDLRGLRGIKVDQSIFIEESSALDSNTAAAFKRDTHTGRLNAKPENDKPTGRYAAKLAKYAKEREERNSLLKSK